MSTRPELIRIYGAGIAGACLAFACFKRGIPVEVVDPNGSGSGGSGNPVAVVEPRLIVQGTTEAEFRISSFLFAAKFYESLELDSGLPIWQMRGVRQFASHAYSQNRLDKISGGVSKPFPEWFDVDGENLLFPTGGAVNTKNILTACLGRSDILPNQTNKVAIEIFATGPEFLPQQYTQDLLPIIPSRGVVSFFRKRNLTEVKCGAGYAVEDNSVMYCGANYLRWMDLGDKSWQAVLDADHAHNKAQAEELLDTKLETPTGGRSSLRSTTPDRMPLVGACRAGAIPDQVPTKHMCIGFGSRGFTYAPIAAEHLIANICGEEGPLPPSLQKLMSPERFNNRIQGTY